MLQSAHPAGSQPVPVVSCKLWPGPWQWQDTNRLSLFLSQWAVISYIISIFQHLNTPFISAPVSSLKPVCDVLEHPLPPPSPLCSVGARGEEGRGETALSLRLGPGWTRAATSKPYQAGLTTLTPSVPVGPAHSYHHQPHRLAVETTQITPDSLSAKVRTVN